MDEVDKLMELCRRAMNGNVDAQDELDLQSVSVEMPRRPNLGAISLQHSFTTALTLATAARKLKRTLLESQCMQTIQYLYVVAASKNLQLDDEIDGQDVAEVMLGILDEVKTWMSVPDAKDKEDSGSEGDTEKIKSTQSDSAIPSETAVDAVPAASARPLEATPSAEKPPSTVPLESSMPTKPAVRAEPAASATPLEATASAEKPP